MSLSTCHRVGESGSLGTMSWSIWLLLALLMCRDSFIHLCPLRFLLPHLGSLRGLAGLPLGLGLVFLAALYPFMPAIPYGKFSATISPTSVGASLRKSQPYRCAPSCGQPGRCCSPPSSAGEQVEVCL